MGGFKDLKAWQKGMDLVEKVYAVSESFPAAETFGLKDQVRRAAVSVPSNVAEGSGRQSSLDFKRFLRIALGSVCEVETQLLLAQRLGYTALDAIKPALKDIDETGRLLRGLLKADATQR